MRTRLQRQYESSPFHGANAPYVEFLYEAYLDDATSVPPQWRELFAGLANGGDPDTAHGPVISAITSRLASASRADHKAHSAVTSAGQASEKQAAVSRLIQVYSMRGHQIADLDPLGLWQRHTPAVLEFGYLGLDEADLDSEFFAGGLAGTGHSPMKLRDILALLKKIYCGKIGAEFAHLSRARERLWLRERFEAEMVGRSFDDGKRRRILESLTRAEGIERYLNTKYVGQKRFSLEGGDSLIPLLDDLIQRSGEQGVQEIVIGMAHRGRLNVLVNVLGKSPQELFSEFEGSYDLDSLTRSGDVKYHLGFSSDIRTAGGNVHVVLAFNPSHLEIVNPVVEGSVRARQDRRGDDAGEHVLPIVIHGDSAMAGQGVVAETFQLSQIREFYTGGTIHIVINNQIGFTTSEISDTRSTPYCSDIAKMVEAPVLHVNGDDPEAVVAVVRLASRYRQRFHKDIVIDLVCYRRLGHNEADEPAATQPLMYQKIKRHPGIRTLYGNILVKQGVVKDDDLNAMVESYRDCLDAGRSPNENCLGMIGNQYTVDWSQYHHRLDEVVATTVPSEQLQHLGRQVTTVPDDFKLHPRVQRTLDDRLKMAAGDLPLDWGYAETLAYASLLADGYHIRLIGQDSRRGTFFHRHATFFSQLDGSEYTPLAHIENSKTSFTIADSPLSEEAVLGFEYGYSTTSPDCLVIWEGQFGDFVNGAQVVIDQFISSGEAKWGRLCGLTLFLPHGYEGQGPEHSSARLERFLQLCAEHNMQVCIPSSPAQMFHLLRRQCVRPARKPLIVLTPKSLLRHRASVSSLADLSSGCFQTIVGDPELRASNAVRRLVFCSGKVYYDLVERRSEEKLDHVAIIRLEELYPFPIDDYARTLKEYPSAAEIVWCQEEPQNQGAWYQIRHRLQKPLADIQRLYYAGRHGAAAPASGIHALHAMQQRGLVAAALGVDEPNGDLDSTNLLRLGVPDDH
jgi:2-oxoglutarate dehydrogenase E1 component